MVKHLRKLDQEIAHLVMGAIVITRGQENDLWEIYEHTSRPLRYFTFNHGDAWTAFEELRRRNEVEVCVKTGNFGINSWEVDLRSPDKHYLGYGKTVPEALSKAMVEYCYNDLQDLI